MHVHSLRIANWLFSFSQIHIELEVIYTNHTKARITLTTRVRHSSSVYTPLYCMLYELQIVIFSRDVIMNNDI